MRPKQPLISICVINYNGSRYLNDCISSILNQTYKNIEIVFCDDASTDESIAIFEELIKDSNHSVKRVYNKKNQGAEQNMLSGIKSFSGDFVCNIDSDDILYSNHIETLYELISTTDSDIACTNHSEFTSEEEVSYKSLAPIQTDFTQAVLLNSKEAIETFYLKGGVIPFAYWHRLYRKENAKKLLKLPPAFFSNSDSAFSVPQFLEANTIVYLDTPTYSYRIQPQSISHKSWYNYLLTKTYGSLDSITNEYTNIYPKLKTLNNYRNQKTIAWALDAIINEGLGYSEFKKCYKKYITKLNKHDIATYSLETANNGHRIGRLLFNNSILGYYLFKRKTLN